MTTFPSLNEVIAKLKTEHQNDLERSRKYAEERLVKDITLVESTRQAAADLDAAGFDIGWAEYSSTKWLHLELGYFPHTKAGNAALADKVRAARVALGCRLEVDDKSVSDAKKRLVLFTLKATDFPGVKIKFVRRLPKSARCKIVTQRSTYTTLVCEME